MMDVAVSMDGQIFIEAGCKDLSYDFTLTEGMRFSVFLSFTEKEAAFVRLSLLSGGLCPQGYYKEGQQSELAIDEIEIH